MSNDNRVNLLHLWSIHHPRDFVRRVEELLTDLYERVESLEAYRDEANKPSIRPTFTKKK